MQLHIRGTGNEVTIGHGAATSTLRLIIIGDGNRVEVGRASCVAGMFTLCGDGNRLLVAPHCRLFPCELYVNNGRRIELGCGCMFSQRVEIRTTDHHPIYDADGTCVNPDGDVILGERVWIGAQAMILKGSRIGNDTVIGARAVVSGEIPSNCVAVGVPARVVRTGIRWQISHSEPAGTPCQ